MFSTPGIIKKINNANRRGYMHDKLKKKLENKNPHNS